MKFNYIFLDFEATSKYPSKAQPCQLSAVAIDPYRLKIIENGIFNSYIKPELDDNKALALGLSPVSDEFTDITKITRDTLKGAPDLKTVWSQFCDYVNRFNPKKNVWDAPIKCGANILSYDNIIINRICGGHFYETEKQDFVYVCKNCTTELVSKKERVACSNCRKKQLELQNLDTTRSERKKIWGYGPWDNEREEELLFNRRFQMDILQLAFTWFESDDSVRSLSFDSMRSMFGIKSDYEAHNSLVDVIFGGMVLCKFLNLSRKVYPDVKFHDSFMEQNKEADRIIKSYWK